jgi:hypothetical protein
MGTNLGYIAVRGKTKEQVWEDLSIELTDVNSGSVMAADLATGWYLVLAQIGSLVDSAEKLSALSTGADVILATVVDTCNYSMTAQWAAGQKTWEVSYWQDQGGLLIKGDPPQPYTEIRSEVQAHYQLTDESDTHYMLVPEILFESYTGYRRDRRQNPCNWNDFRYFQIRQPSAFV